MRRLDPADRGWLILKGLGVVLAITVLGLVLDGFGVGLGGYVVLAAVLLFVVVFYVLPWLPGRRG